jgi:anti-anti-sigma factor
VVVLVTPVSAQPSLSFLVEELGSSLRVAVSGELDFACTALFDALFDLGTEGVRSIVVDLGGLTFCDLAGATAVTGFCAYHRHEGRAVLVVEVLPQVRRVLELNEDVRWASRSPR